MTVAQSLSEREIAIIEREMTQDGDAAPTSVPTTKVMAATTGSAAGGALGTVICWIISLPGVLAVSPPTAVEGAIVTLCSVLTAGAAGWLKAPCARCQIIVRAGQRPRTGRRKSR